MQNITRNVVYLSGLLLMVIACIDPFDPPEINSDDRFLVFDGYVNANGTDTSWIRLSRTQNIHEWRSPEYEDNAQVTVENEQGAVFTFQRYQTAPGTYFLPPQHFSLAEDYRLSMTLDGKVYQSDWQQFTASPPIDSISYDVNGREGIQIYVHTHDPTNQTRFYKWTFDETWEYEAALFSYFEVIDSMITEREIPVNRCWSSLSATNINVFTTAPLSSDVVRKHPITYVPAAGNKLLRGYSIRVNQQALTREAYDYWTELARNNETNGSIFDPFPSQLSGNIKAVDDQKERVFGFFSGGITQSERTFIRVYLGTIPQCFETDTLTLDEILESTHLIASELAEAPGTYVTAPPNCIDCRLQGGTIERPEFWR